jgi:hypothetical protein
MPDKRQETRRVKLGELTVDPHIQMRAAVDAEHVARLAEVMRTSRDRLPPGKAYDDGNGTLWLSRGFHRFYAHEAVGAATMEVHVVKGSRRDALADAMADNAEHLALPRSNADKRRAVMTALADAEWTELPDREIAKRCAVSHTFVATIRAELDSAAGRKAAATGSPAPAAAGNVATPAPTAGTAQSVGNVASQNPVPGAARAISGGNVASPPAAPDASAGRETGPQQPSPPESIPLDQTGRPVPAWLRPAFAARSSLLELAGDVSLVKRRLGEMNKTDPGGAFLDMQDIGGKADALHFLIKRDMPHAVCRLCGGRKGGCEACDKQGWLPKERYEATTPKELKDPPPAGGKGRAA